MDAESKTQLVVLLPVSEKGFIVDAAKEAGADSLSAFIRETMLEKSCRILGRDPPRSIAPMASLAPSAGAMLHIHIGDRPPPDARTPAMATSFPSLHAFAAHFCDRNRAILRWIGAHEAESIHELSRRFDYSYAGLSRTLRSLAAFGVIGYDVRADARCQAPLLLCRRIRLHLSFRDAGSEPVRICNVAMSGPESSRADFVCASMDAFSTVITDRGYALLRLIAAHDPPTIGALGKLTGKTSQNAYPLLRRLATFGLVGFDGSSRKKKPLLLYDGLTFDIDLLA